MRRREVIAGVGVFAAVWPSAMLAQQAPRVRRIGLLVGLSADDPGMKPRRPRQRTRTVWMAGRPHGQHRPALRAGRRRGRRAGEGTGRATAGRHLGAHCVRDRSAATPHTRNSDCVRERWRSFGSRLYRQSRAARREPDRAHDLRSGHLGQMGRYAQRGHARSYPGHVCSQT
jgi:hypothetical protein